MEKVKTIVIVILVFFVLRGCKEENELYSLYEASNSELLKEINEKGQEKTRRVFLEAENKEVLEELKTKDSTLLKLKKLVESYKGKLESAVVVSNNTKVITKLKTVVIHDTTRIDSEYPIYKGYFKNKWEVVEITAKKDSIDFTCKIRNEFEITLGEESNGWFKGREKRVSILNLNPNTQTTELQSFLVRNKPKRLTIGIQAGYGLGLENMDIQPFIGIGVNYTIFSVK